MKKGPISFFIMADDHAAQAISAYGHELGALAPTPNIDRLAKNGVLFSNHSFIDTKGKFSGLFLNERINLHIKQIYHVFCLSCLRYSIPHFEQIYKGFKNNSISQASFLTRIRVWLVFISNSRYPINIKGFISFASHCCLPLY